MVLRFLNVAVSWDYEVLLSWFQGLNPGLLLCSTTGLHLSLSGTEFSRCVWRPQFRFSKNIVYMRDCVPLMELLLSEPPQAPLKPVQTSAPACTLEEAWCVIGMGRRCAQVGDEETLQWSLCPTGTRSRVTAYSLTVISVPSGLNKSRPPSGWSLL